MKRSQTCKMIQFVDQKTTIQIHELNPSYIQGELDAKKHIEN